MSTRDRYVLATGDAGAARLRLLDEVHGPATRSFLLRAGLGPGMRVADIGCGTGAVSCWMARQVGLTGTVVGIDASKLQVPLARHAAERAGLHNTQFIAADARYTSLPEASFDLVFCRFLLMHVPEPQEVVNAMAWLVKPGGVLACEDGDFTSPFANPPSAAYDRAFELFRAAVASRGGDPHIGPKLQKMLLAAGLQEPSATTAQEQFTNGEGKRLPEWTLAECAPALVQTGIATREEIDAVVGELRSLALDVGTLFAMVQSTQVLARK